MNTILYPKHVDWETLLKRPTKDAADLNRLVADVLADVKANGDQAVKAYEQKFDHVELADLRVSEEEFQEAERLVDDELKEAIAVALTNIEKFHANQRFHGEHCQVTDGVECWQKSIAIEKVGLYIPGGTAPLFSTVLMLGVPARIAGCREIVLCTPPQRDGRVNPAVLVAARMAGVTRVFKVGGVQAIGAMAYGTESIPRVYKIFGPGNQFVMCAKQQVSLHDVAIDMPAGPSEVMVLADESSNPSFVAADLLSQVEHGPDSQVVMLTTDETMAKRVAEEVERQVSLLPRQEIARKSLESSKLIVLKDDEEMMRMANMYAPEHLIIETKNYMQLAEQVINAGSVFLGSLTPESAGDYASGTNHTLPTNGYATAYSGVNLDSYMRKVTFQHITPQGVRAIGPAVEKMAEAEGLDAHRMAMLLRRESLQ